MDRRVRWLTPKPNTREYLLKEFLNLEWHTVSEFRYYWGEKYDDYKEEPRIDFKYDCLLGGEALTRFGVLLEEASIGNEFHIDFEKENILFSFRLTKKYNMDPITRVIIRHKTLRKQRAETGDYKIVSIPAQAIWEGTREEVLKDR